MIESTLNLYTTAQFLKKFSNYCIIFHYVSINKSTYYFSTDITRFINQFVGNLSFKSQIQVFKMLKK